MLKQPMNQVQGMVQHDEPCVSLQFIKPKPPAGTAEVRGKRLEVRENKYPDLKVWAFHNAQNDSLKWTGFPPALE